MDTQVNDNQLILTLNYMAVNMRVDLWGSKLMEGRGDVVEGT
jgi:hypothetical protein